MNMLKLKEAKPAILRFTHMKSHEIPTQFSLYKIFEPTKRQYGKAFSYDKYGATQNKTSTHLAKKISDYIVSKRITSTAKYLPGALNK